MDMTIQIYLQHQLLSFSKKKSYICVIFNDNTHSILKQQHAMKHYNNLFPYTCSLLVIERVGVRNETADIKEDGNPIVIIYHIN